jgi:hypothetical protein
LRACGRERRFCAAQSACTNRYPRVFVEFRATSRDTTDGARPICRAIPRSDQPAFNPVEISARSPTVNILRPATPHPDPAPPAGPILPKVTREAM